MISRVTKYGLRALLGLAGLYALAISAGAQSREIFGYAGVLGEWEIIAAVAHFGAPVDNEGSNSRRFPEIEQKCPAPQTYLNEQTASLCGREREVSAGRPNSLQEALSLFNDLIGTHKQRGWDRDAEGLRGLQIDCKFKLCRLFDR